MAILPKGTALSHFFVAAPGQVRFDRVMPLGILAGRPLVYRSFTSRLLPRQPDFPTGATLLLGLGCPTCCHQSSRAGAMQPSYCFRGTTATRRPRPGILSRSRTMCLIASAMQTHDPRACMRAFGLRSSYSHTTLAVSRHPFGSRDREAIPVSLTILPCTARLPVLDFLGTGRLLPWRAYEIPPDLA